MPPSGGETEIQRKPGFISALGIGTSVGIATL